MSEEKKNPEKDDKEFVNPIDSDKVAENPSLLTYAHNLGSAIIKPEDRGKIKATSLASMYQQTDVQLEQIKEQIELLARQAQAIHSRVEISELVYQARMNFKPLVGHTYYLYQNVKNEFFMSLVGPDEWGRGNIPDYCASVKLLADHTWEVLDESQDFFSNKS